MNSIDQSQFPESEDAPVRLRRPPFENEPPWHDEGPVSYILAKCSAFAFLAALLLGLFQVCGLTEFGRVAIDGWWWRSGTASILFLIAAICTDFGKGE